LATMLITQKSMDQWARQVLRMSGCLLRLTTHLKRTQTRLPKPLHNDLTAARRLSILLMRSLVRAGASDPIDAAWIVQNGQEPMGEPLSEAMRNSLKAKAYAQAIRAAADACREMEIERDSTRALFEVLNDFADQAEQELNQAPAPL